MSYALRWLIIGISMLAASGTAYAKEKTREQLQVLYRYMAEDIEANSHKRFDAFVEHRRAGTHLPEQEENELYENTKILFEIMDYQDMIDQMYCWEKSEQAEDWIKCAEERADHTKAMFKFMTDYTALRLTIAKCSVKTRLLELEVRYPPYTYMTSSPEAHDAKGFLECVRSKL